VPWLWPRWRAALRDRETLLAVLLGWIVIVVAFFSASSGKRGLYILPAVPAFAMVAAPWLPELFLARGPRRVAFVLAATLTAVTAAGAVYFAVDSAAAERVLQHYAVRPVLPLAVAAVAAGIALYVFRIRDGWLAYASVLAVTVVTIGVVIEPHMNAVRSGRAFAGRLEQASAGIAELGLLQAKEQYLLQLRRPSVNFGHARWKDWESEAADAAVWFAERPGRALLVDRRAREACFPRATAVDLGRANRKHWFLVTGEAEADCVKRGDRSRAIHYAPPDDASETES
jgi:4-amino-4-deoxy-L-arabinose transferase-like glycosyltransferase